MAGNVVEGPPRRGAGGAKRKQQVEPTVPRRRKFNLAHGRSPEVDMSRVLLVLTAVPGIIIPAEAVAAEKSAPLAGWYGVFPELIGYQLTLAAPKLGADKKTTYQQTAKYEWTGGAIRSLTVTPARDLAFKKGHGAAALKKQGYREVKVGKKTAWLLGTDKDGIDATRQLVLPLGDETALLVEARGSVGDDALVEIAARFDADRLAAALKAPPRTDFGRSLEAFRALKKGAPLHDVYTWAGQPDGTAGKGVLEYKLGDGSRVLVGTRDLKEVSSVNHEKDGKSEDLLK
jgi:hypothetical protein